MKPVALIRVAPLAALLALALPSTPSLAASDGGAAHKRATHRHQHRAHKHRHEYRGGRTHGAGGEEESQRGLVVIPRSATNPELSYFELEGIPGQTVQAGAIELLNPGERTVRAKLAPVDGRTLDTLGSAYAPGGSAAHGSTRWLLLGARSVVLPPHDHTFVDVAVRIPSNASPGDRLSGVSIEEQGQPADVHAAGEGVATASVVRYAIGIETSLPGARRPKIRFKGATVERKPAGLTFALKLRNSGNATLQDVHGKVAITRAGHTVISRPILAGTFLAGTSIAYPVPAFGEQPPEGTRYRVRATLRYPGGVAKLDRSVTFGHRAALVQQSFGGPGAGDGGGEWWKVGLAVAVGLYCLVATSMLLRRRRDGSPARGIAHGDGAPR